MRKLKVEDATRSSVITKSTFSGYDFCLNPYVGCQFGCAYCYVRFFVKDKDAEWGEFVRVRKHVKDKLPKELPKIAGKRLVLGTMTDPYQPAERTHRITRTALEKILEAKQKPAKVGIFTRSPIVLDDIDLIRQLPRARVHYTITPYDRDVLVKLEPIAVRTEKRFEVVKKLKQAGIRVHVNIAPVIPYLSDHLTQQFADGLADAGVDEFFVDPMQAYRDSFDATFRAISDLPQWEAIKETMLDKTKYDAWKMQYSAGWLKAWSKYKDRPILPIWSDHANGRLWVDMRTCTLMDNDVYGDDLAP